MHVLFSRKISASASQPQLVQEILTSGRLRIFCEATRTGREGLSLETSSSLPVSLLPHCGQRYPFFIVRTFLCSFGTVPAMEFDPADVTVGGEGFFLAGSAGEGDLLHDELSAIALYRVTVCLAAADDANRIFSAHGVELLLMVVYLTS